MSPVVAVMLVATIIATVYLALIAMHVLAIRAGEPSGKRYHPRIARWLAAGDERRRGRAESDAARRLLAGSLDRASYRAAMAAMAAQDAIEHPFDIPKSKM
ncbi:hypothetical protein AB0K00_19370 [Dactylosporangium sp. NPDC049525]|uniref:hypothetical protein n=1 Tax=Dactylosporangium sp. NPDC049525 TaxID=3154730 RepID=UPI003437725C